MEDCLHFYGFLAGRFFLTTGPSGKTQQQVGFFEEAMGSHILEGTVLIASQLGDNCIPRLC